MQHALQTPTLCQPGGQHMCVNSEYFNSTSHVYLAASMCVAEPSSPAHSPEQSRESIDPCHATGMLAGSAGGAPTGAAASSSSHRAFSYSSGVLKSGSQ